MTTGGKPYQRTRSAGDGTINKLDAGTYRSELRWTDASGTKQRNTRITHSLRDANKALTELKRQRDSGQDPKTASTTLVDLLDKWLDFKRAEVTAGTIDQYEYAVRHLKGETDVEYAERVKQANLSEGKEKPKRYMVGLGKVPLAKLQPRQIDTFLKSKTDEGLSPRYVKLLRTVLSMSLDQAVKWRLVDTNVAKYSISVKQDQSHGRALSEDQARALLEAAKTDRLGALWVVLLALGLRRGEALALTWGDYDTIAATLSVSKNRKREGSRVVTGDLKTAASRRVIPLPAFVCDALDDHRVAQDAEKDHLLCLGVAWTAEGAMFTTAWGHWLDPANGSKLFKTVAAKAGLGDWHVHEMRHSAATILLSNGVPLEQVSKLLGHSSIRITSDTYSHLLTEHLRGATDTMGGYLSGLSGGATSDAPKS